MELVYLWVEDYKNIHKQGFNFSPRFECKFYDEYEKDENGKDRLKDNCQLEIIEKKEDEYIKDFFGKNINVTAIVGKNGSGKSSVLEILEDRYNRELKYLIIYREEGKNYCECSNISLNSVSNIDITFIDKNNNYSDKSFYPKIIRIAHNKKIGEKSLSHYYFGIYSGLYGGWNIERHDFYNLLEARFFVPRYINIAIEHFKIFNKLKYMYKFNTLRLILKNNSTIYLRKWIDNEVLHFKDRNQIVSSLDSKIFCIYEENENVLTRIKKEIKVPIENVEINLYDRNRENIVSLLEEIENIHRSQSYDNPIKKFNKYSELDLAILIAFIEYYLKNTAYCESTEIIYNELLKLKENIKDNLFLHEHLIRITQSYILDFFINLKNKKIIFQDNNLLLIDDIIEAVKYLQKYNVIYFDQKGNAYLDIEINKNLKENIHHIKIMQKIFFDYEFDCGEEEYLRVFEYTLVNKEVGSSYETISDGEKHFIQFAIDIIYHLQTLSKQNFTPEIEQLAIFLADEPDNSLHPFWKKRVISNIIEILKEYLNIPNLMVHFIYSTHSPFLLSDIPKQNIIFLDKDEKGNCQVVDGLKEKKQTFGANIHTLLSDSFFMENGLMGEFANGKIDKVIKLLNKEKLDEKELKYCEQIISIIGEPIVKNQLQRMLDSKRLKKVDEIDKIYEEIELLKHRIEILRKD